MYELKHIKSRQNIGKVFRVNTIKFIYGSFKCTIVEISNHKMSLFSYVSMVNIFSISSMKFVLSVLGGLYYSRKHIDLVVPGFEPRTSRKPAECSTIELHMIAVFLLFNSL